MAFAVVCPVGGIHNTNNPLRNLDWWDAGGKHAEIELATIARIVAEAGATRIGITCPYGSAGPRVEANQIRRLPTDAADAVETFTSVVRKSGASPFLYTGIGAPLRTRAAFVLSFGIPSGNPHDWLLPTILSDVDRLVVVRDYAAAKAIGFEEIIIDQLAQIDDERPGEGGLFARYIKAKTGLVVTGEAHWVGDYTTHMMSLGMHIDERNTAPRFINGVRDEVWLNGHTMIERGGTAKVHTPADQVRAAERFEGFTPCYEVDSVSRALALVRALN